ncbi:MAG: DUF305 domain-containing protein [Pseudomonadota bacterium]
MSAVMRRLGTVLVLVAAGAVQAETPMAGHGHHAMSPAPRLAGFPADFQAFVRRMDADMARMMADMHGPGYTGDADVDFLAMMIPHHQGAVDMARLVQIHGRDPLTRRLAEEIIASQQAEIMAMQARLAILRRGADPDPGGYPALHGTRGRHVDGE